MAARKAKARRESAPPKMSSKYDKAIREARNAPVGADFWRPKTEDEAVAGKILSHEWKDWGDRHSVTIAVDTGEQVIKVGLWTVLVSEFAARAVKVGSEIAIVYKGTAARGARGKPPMLFSLVVIKEGSGAVVVTPEQAAANLERKPAKGKGRRTKTAPRSRRKAG